MSPLQSVLLTAAGWLAACLAPLASPSCMPQAWQAPGGHRVGLSRRAGRVQNHGSHHAVSTMGTGEGSGWEEGMVPTSDGELRQSQLQKPGGEVPFGKLVVSTQQTLSCALHPDRLYRTLCIYYFFSFFFFFNFLSFSLEKGSLCAPS